MHIGGNELLSVFLGSRLLQGRIASEADRHLLVSIRDELQYLQNLGKLFRSLVCLHHNHTHRTCSAAKIPLPRKGDSPLGSGSLKKIAIRISRLIERVIAEDSEPFRQGSQVTIRDESDIHAITQERSAVA